MTTVADIDFSRIADSDELKTIFWCTLGNARAMQGKMAEQGNAIGYAHYSGGLAMGLDVIALALPPELRPKGGETNKKPALMRDQPTQFARERFLSVRNYCGQLVRAASRAGCHFRDYWGVLLVSDRQRHLLHHVAGHVYRGGEMLLLPVRTRVATPSYGYAARLYHGCRHILQLDPHILWTGFLALLLFDGRCVRLVWRGMGV